MLSVLNLIASLLSLASLIALIVFIYYAVRKRPGASRNAALAFAGMLLASMLYNATMSPEQRVAEAAKNAPTPQVQVPAQEALPAQPVSETQPAGQASPPAASASSADSGSQKPTEAPEINVQAEATGPFEVKFDVNTNLPDGAVLAVSLGLADQQPDDIAIGTSFERFTVSGGKVSGMIDGTKRVMPMNSTLPAGKYDVEVSFHPLWEENRALAQQLGIGDSVTGTTQVELAASGENAQVAQTREQNQKWVMMNVNMGDPWDAADFVSRFGAYEELSLESGNPDILKMYYFPELDMTFMVNVLKGQIEVWRMGQAHR
ncbi:hypothetical protein WDJ50_02535 [Deinococcus sp. VB142]|uniref:Uncharacterized protein n=1 Tax=Deinococcus sp. VB142 TaxID=3112952 RepID=A0AAU6Q330_9DEIO